MENMRESNINCSPIPSSTSKFVWDGNVSRSLNSSVNVSKNVNDHSLMNTRASFGSNNKRIINQRLYADVCSKGLVSRIVKYHDDNLPLNNISLKKMHYKFNQRPPAQVNMRRNEKQFKPNQSDLKLPIQTSTIDKPIFQVANIRSGILNSPPIVSTLNLQETEAAFLCENKPILHPADSDLVPTKSVLDALKEISRKRINTDGLNANDNIKKYCTESENISYNIGASPLLNLFTTKRQLSPIENFSKKRICTRHNDIIGSLSSSINVMTQKRKNCYIQNWSKKSNEKNNEYLSTSANRLSQEHSCKSNLNKINLVNQTEQNILSGKINEISQKNEICEENNPKISTTVENVTEHGLRLFTEYFDNEYFKEKLKKIRDNKQSEINFKFLRPHRNLTKLENNTIKKNMEEAQLKLMFKYLKGELTESCEELEIEYKTDSVEEQVSEYSDSNKSDVILAATASASISFATNTTNSTPIISSSSVATSCENIKNQAQNSEKSESKVFEDKVSTTSTSNNSITYNSENSIKSQFTSDKIDTFCNSPCSFNNQKITQSVTIPTKSSESTNTTYEQNSKSANLSPKENSTFNILPSNSQPNNSFVVVTSSKVLNDNTSLSNNDAVTSAGALQATSFASNFLQKELTPEESKLNLSRTIQKSNSTHLPFISKLAECSSFKYPVTTTTIQSTFFHEKPQIGSIPLTSISSPTNESQINLSGSNLNFGLPLKTTNENKCESSSNKSFNFNQLQSNFSLKNLTPGFSFGTNVVENKPSFEFKNAVTQHDSASSGFSFSSSPIPSKVQTVISNTNQTSQVLPESSIFSLNTNGNFEKSSFKQIKPFSFGTVSSPLENPASVSSTITSKEISNSFFGTNSSFTTSTAEQQSNNTKPFTFGTPINNSSEISKPLFNFSTQTPKIESSSSSEIFLNCNTNTPKGNRPIIKATRRLKNI